MAYKDRSQMIQSVNAYNKIKYDRVTVMLPSGEREKLKAYARAHGESVNSYLLRLIQEDMKKEDQGNP